MRLIAAALVFALALVAPATAETSVDGAFTAKKSCPALQSFRKGTNPGDITVVPGTTYGVIAIDANPANYYYITVPGANPAKRWVAAECGDFAAGNSPTTSDESTTTEPDAPATGTTNYILAISWEPAFCERRPRVTECRTQTTASPDARQFSLHGLWPQPRSNAYCGVSGDDRSIDDTNRWRDLPAVTLSAATRSALDAAMPGTQSALERHEWIVHGTCYGGAQERYFSDAITALAAVNASPLARLFAANIGKRISLDQIRTALDQGFGRGAGDRARLACDDDGGRRLISEITLGLASKSSTPSSFATALRNGAPTDGGCDGGIVDPAGQQ